MKVNKVATNAKFIQKFEQTVYNFLKGHNLTSLVVGVSGGADSMALLHSLNSVRQNKDIKLQIHAVHCNFHLRSQESNRDMNFVVGQCQEHGIRLTVCEFDTTQYQEEHGISLEMSCRELRYNKFAEILDDLHFEAVAVAHNKEDNAETLFLNLMRGAGVSGLRGMLPVAGNVVRPLLEVSRSDILKYLKYKKLEYITDSTNYECEYLRNYIRNKIIPSLQIRWPNAVDSICRSIDILRQSEKVLDWAERHLISNKEYLDYQTISRAPDQRWLIMRFIDQYGGTRHQMEEIYKSINSQEFQSGKFWIVSQGRIFLEREGLEFIGNSKPEFSVSIENHRVDTELLSRITSAPLSEFWTSLPETKIYFRYIRTGDRIKSLGLKGSVLISKIMKDSKLSKSQKDNTVVAVDCETDEILWVEGLKRSRLHLVTSDTKNAILIKINKI